MSSTVPFISGANAIGHVAEFRRDRLAFFRRAGREVTDMARIKFFHRGGVLFNSPERVHELLVEKARFVEKSSGLRALLWHLAGDGLFTSEGELWKRQRKLMAPIFQHSQIAGFGRVMVDCANRAVDGWAPGATVDVARETTRITMSVVGKTLFDSETFDEADEIGEALTVALDWVGHRAGTFAMVAHMTLLAGLREIEEREGSPLWVKRAAAQIHERNRGAWLLPFGNDRVMRDAIARLDARMQRMIDERRAQGLSGTDLLTRLLRAQDEDSGARMSDKQIRDEANTLFVAGHETTATGLAWAFYLLARNPEAYAKLLAEVDALGGRTPTAQDLPRLAYCTKVFKESLRIYPPVYFFGRQISHDVEIGGHRLPRGTVCFVSPYMLHRREDVWPDPERFDPERFTPEGEASRHKSAWLPFGAGPRICIGNHFALMEGALVLATISQRVRLELEPGHEVVLPEPQSTLRPGELRMRVIARDDEVRGASAGQRRASA